MKFTNEEIDAGTVTKWLDGDVLRATRTPGWPAIEKRLQWRHQVRADERGRLRMCVVASYSEGGEEYALASPLESHDGHKIENGAAMASAVMSLRVSYAARLAGK